jgi:hypothetical protein
VEWSILLPRSRACWSQVIHFSLDMAVLSAIIRKASWVGRPDVRRSALPLSGCLWWSQNWHSSMPSANFRARNRGPQGAIRTDSEKRSQTKPMRVRLLHSAI